VEGKLKAEIIQDPARYVSRDPEMAQTLLDQRQAGKQLLLITNSDFHYTDRMMSFAYDCFLPPGQTWRDLFDMVGGGRRARVERGWAVCGVGGTYIRGARWRCGGARTAAGSGHGRDHLEPRAAQPAAAGPAPGPLLRSVSNPLAPPPARVHSLSSRRPFTRLSIIPPPFLPCQVIVNARKPDFFISSMSLYEVVTEDGLMRPSFSLRRGGVYCGGSGGPCGTCSRFACAAGRQGPKVLRAAGCPPSPQRSLLVSLTPVPRCCAAAALVEKALGVAGDSILYVGDHICEPEPELPRQPPQLAMH
jgi:hypothetical protein